jgi:hypothetical protein
MFPFFSFDRFKPPSLAEALAQTVCYDCEENAHTLFVCDDDELRCEECRDKRKEKEKNKNE